MAALERAGAGPSRGERAVDVLLGDQLGGAVLPHPVLGEHVGSVVSQKHSLILSTCRPAALARPISRSYCRSPSSDPSTHATAASRRLSAHSARSSTASRSSVRSTSPLPQQCPQE